MYEYAYDCIWYAYDEIAHFLYYMLISFTYEYVLVYVFKVRIYVFWNAMLFEVVFSSWFLLGYLIE